VKVGYDASRCAGACRPGSKGSRGVGAIFGLPDARGAAVQEGRPLGERLKWAWEWDTVMKQVADFGWTSLDIRCPDRAIILPHDRPRCVDLFCASDQPQKELRSVR
jgi:hypothetical protein